MGLLWSLLASVSLPGCVGSLFTPKSSATVRSLGDDPVELIGTFQTVFYSHDELGTSFIISDIPADELATGAFESGQVLHIELLWLPKAGSTPVDRSATNASIRYLIFADGQLGVYGGAGFILPGGRVGKPKLSLNVRQATLTLLESTPQFVDLLSPAEMVGKFTAILDPRQTRRLYFNLSQQVTNTLGKTRFVLGNDAQNPGRIAIAVP